MLYTKEIQITHEVEHKSKNETGSTNLNHIPRRWKRKATRHLREGRKARVWLVED